MYNNNNGNSTVLCIVSLLLMFVAPVAGFVVAGIFTHGELSQATAPAYLLVIPANIISYIAAWVTAIIAAAKYKSKFGTVLLIIYGGMIALGVIGMIVGFFSFITGVPS